MKFMMRKDKEEYCTAIVKKLSSIFIILLIAIFITFYSIKLPCAATDVSPTDRALEAGFVPHKALYDIKLKSKKSSSKISNLRGKMMYEWHSTCDAWVSKHQFDMLYEYIEMPAVRMTSDFSTYESFDGQSLNFSSERKRGDDLFEEIRGSASKTGGDHPDEIVYSIPKELVLDLPKGTLFPMAHTLDVIEKIKSGNKFYTATIFDGSDEEGAVDVNSFIGKEVPYFLPEEYKSHKPHIDESLISAQAHSIRLAFFPLATSEITADYEMSITFHDNGVISDMKIDYDNFSITQTLIAIEKTENKCELENIGQ